MEVLEALVVGHGEKLDDLLPGRTVGPVLGEQGRHGDREARFGVVPALEHCFEGDVQIGLVGMEEIRPTETVVSQVEPLDHAVGHEV